MNDTIQRPQPLPETGLTGPGGKRLPWGPIQRIHRIGEYEIVEYLRDESSLSNYNPENSDHGKPAFGVWVNGQDTHRSFYSLDEALVFAVAYKYDGINTRAHTYFMKGVGA